MPKTYLEGIDFSEKATENTCGAHIAYTFDFQGGAASGYNTPLLFKGNKQDAISFDKIEKLAKLGEDISQIKKDYISQLMSILDEKVQDKFQSGWDWVYTIDADFDNNVAIFCSDSGMYSVGFTLDGLVFTLDDTASPVISITDYQAVDGDVMISNDFFMNIIDEAIGNLAKSAYTTPKVKELLVKAYESNNQKDSVKTEETSQEVSPSVQTKGEFQLDIQELMKSAEFQELFKAETAKIAEEAKAEAKIEAEKEIAKAKAQADAEIESLRKAARDAQIADTEIIVKNLGFIAEEDHEAIIKHLVDSPEAVTELLLKAFDSAKTSLDTVKKELGEEKGLSVETKVEKSQLTANEAIAARAAKIKAEKAAK